MDNDPRLRLLLLEHIQLRLTLRSHLLLTNPTVAQKSYGCINGERIFCLAQHRRRHSESKLAEVIEVKELANIQLPTQSSFQRRALSFGVIRHIIVISFTLIFINYHFSNNTISSIDCSFYSDYRIVLQRCKKSAIFDFYFLVRMAKFIYCIAFWRRAVYINFVIKKASDVIT